MTERIENLISQASKLRKEKEYNSAIKLLNEALQLDQERDHVYFCMGNVFFDAGDLAKAEQTYRKAVRINSKHVNALHNLSVVLKKQGKIAESVKVLKSAHLLELRGIKAKRLGVDAETVHQEDRALRRISWQMGLMAVVAVVLFFYILSRIL